MAAGPTTPAPGGAPVAAMPAPAPAAVPGAIPASPAPAPTPTAPRRTGPLPPAPVPPSSAGPAATAIVAALALLPWLAVVPIGGALGVLAQAIALAAALHGAGLALALIAGAPAVHPLLAVQWGAAVLIGLVGIALAAGAGGLIAQTLLIYGFAAVHTAVLALRFEAYRARVAATRATLRVWLAPACLLAAIGALHVLGGAGDLGARPFDDDGHVLAQLQRLRDTGALGDPLGYARHAQLGGQLAFDALATAGGDVHLIRLAEGLAFALALALAVGLVLAPRPGATPDPARGLWALLLILAGAAFTYVRPDPGACWTAVGLVLALHATLTERLPASSQLSAGAPPLPMPLGAVGGALIALRFELAPIAAAALLAAWWPRRRELRHAALLAGAALAVVAPFAIARIAAWTAVPAAARALVEPARAPLVAQLALFVVAAVACAPLVAIAWRSPALRWLGAGAALAIAGIASGLTGDRPYATSFLWPLAIAGALALVLELARAARITTAALLVSLVVVVLIYEGSTAGGRRRWSRRYVALAHDVGYLRTARDPAAIAGGYAPLQRAVPPGAIVAAWVGRPERLDYGAGHTLYDLRTPRGAWLRGAPPWSRDPRTGPLARLLAAAAVDFLLVEDDRVPPGRAGDLEALARAHPTIAEAGGARLVDVRGLRAP